MKPHTLLPGGVNRMIKNLEHDASASALATLAPLRSAQHSSPCGVLENLANALAGLGRALEIMLGTDLLRNGHALMNNE